MAPAQVTQGLMSQHSIIVIQKTRESLGESGVTFEKSLLVTKDAMRFHIDVPISSYNKHVNAQGNWDRMRSKVKHTKR